MSLNNAQIVGKLLQGSSLYTVMVPDPAIPSNRPEHIEGFHLNHIIVSGDYFWGLSGGRTLFDNLEGIAHGRFGYTNIDHVFFSQAVTSSTIILMDTRRYKEHNWNIVDECALIWDKNTAPDNKKVIEAVQGAIPLKVALLDDEDVWNIHPVDITYFRLEEHGFSLRTTFISYPMILRYPDQLKTLLAQANIGQKMDVIIDGDYGVGAGLSYNVESFASSLLIREDGTYQTVYDQLRKNTKQTYKELKIFADKAALTIDSSLTPSYDHSTRVEP